MLSVKWKADTIRLSMHRFFLEAPEEILESVRRYVERKSKVPEPLLKDFMAENVKKLNYSSLLEQEKLDYRGKQYNLLHYLTELNKIYFNENLKLYITWCGQERCVRRSRFTLGQYNSALRLVKIHRRLDSPFFPEFVLSFVIYHEMLHAACPPLVRGGEPHHIHNALFKKREKEFQDYAIANKWIKEHSRDLFK